jgi:hypothetical protein
MRIAFDPKISLIFCENKGRWSGAIGRHPYVRQACTLSHAIDWEDLAMEIQKHILASIVFVDVQTDASTDKLRAMLARVDLLGRTPNNPRFVAIGTPAVLHIAQELRIAGFCEVFGRMSDVPRAVRLIQRHAKSVTYPAMPIEETVSTNLPWRPI